ncbi:MAG: hypothetical protein M1268_01185 [Patescibacteria group bacterium]|nr:hypothetical protein [Patescibacteria group bacterium]
MERGEITPQRADREFRATQLKLRNGVSEETECYLRARLDKIEPAILQTHEESPPSYENPEQILLELKTLERMGKETRRC